MKTETHSQRAIAAAMQAMGCHERTAIVVLFMGLGEEAKRILGDEPAALLAYQIADQLAVEVQK
jgi:hypothetical protein